MGFKDIVSSHVADAKGMLEAVGEKLAPLLAEYKSAMKQMEAFGFKASKMTVGMGVLPEVHTSLVGRVADVDIDRLTVMMNENKENKLMDSLLKALIFAKKIHSRAESKLESVTLLITLGLPPGIKVEFT